MSSKSEKPDWKLGTSRDYENLASALGTSEEFLFGDDSDRWSGQHDERDHGIRPPKQRSGWDALYYAKRILQTNSRDTFVRKALNRSPLTASDLEYDERGRRQANPLLGHLDAESMRNFLLRAQLVERKYNEFICREGEYGDTMFVVLRGEVGIYRRDNDDSLQSHTPAFTMGEGEVVGELAFAMGGKRTADVICLTDTAVLAISSRDVAPPAGDQDAVPRAYRNITDGVTRFTVSRVVEHVSHRLDYLLGNDRHGPLGFGGAWRENLSALEQHTKLHSVPKDAYSVDLRELDSAAEGGLFILLSGAVAPLTAPDNILHFDHLPMLHINLNGAVVTPMRRFNVASSQSRVENEQVRILQIKAAGIRELPTENRLRLVDLLKRSVLRECYSLDVFIAHNSEDRSEALAWKEYLEQRDLKVHLESEPKPYDKFDDRLLGILQDSRLVVALISSHVTAKPAEDNWVLRELQYRRRTFEEPCIMPIRITGGQPQALLQGFHFVDATINAESAMLSVADVAQKLRDGDAPSPFCKRLPPLDDHL